MQQPRPIDLSADLPGVAALLGQARARGAQLHPGGTQWWLRELGRDGLIAYVWRGSSNATPNAFLLVDGDLVLLASDETAGGPSRIEMVSWAERHVADQGGDSVAIPLARDDPLTAVLEARGYRSTSIELELMRDIDDEPARPKARNGYRFGSIVDIGDEAFIELHRASWSDVRPSPYRRELHDAVKRMPAFRPDLVTVALAPDGTPAAYCIGWADELSRTLEIEPLGTHRDHRRRGLGRAVVHEITRRAWGAGMKHVLVWNEPERNPAAYGLYTSAGMTARREIVRLERALP